MVTRKLVVVMEGGNIPELNNVMGPITFPTRITIKAIAALVKADKKVFECDPKDPYNKDARIRLTKENFLGDNFGKEPVPVVPDPPKEPISSPVNLEKGSTSPKAPAEDLKPSSDKVKSEVEELKKIESVPTEEEEIIIPNSVQTPNPEKKEEVTGSSSQVPNTQNNSGKNNKNNKGKK